MAKDPEKLSNQIDQLAKPGPAVPTAGVVPPDATGVKNSDHPDKVAVFDQVVKKYTRTAEMRHDRRYLIMIDGRKVGQDVMVELAKGFHRHGWDNVLLYMCGDIEAVRVFEQVDPKR